MTRPLLPFSVITKPTGATCNLACDYCFFLSKELLYPSSRSLMTTQVLEAYIDQMFAAQPGPNITLAFQGGEPTMRGLPFYRRAVEIAQERRPHGIELTYTMQTNGTLLDDEWGAFLRDHGFLVGLSIDGPREMHDAYRVNRAGRGTFDQVVRGWRVLERYGVERNILTTVHAANQGDPLAVYHFLRDELGAEFIQFIPIVERVDEEDLAQATAGWGEGNTTRILYRQRGHAVTARSVTPAAYGRFLSEVFDEWLRHDVGSVFVQIFDVMLGAAFGEYSLCVHSPECGNQGVLEHNGDVYSCDHFVEPGYLLGNVTQAGLGALMSSEQQRDFGRAKRLTLPQQCVTCPVRWACHGGCPKDRFLQTAAGEDGLSYLCAGYQQFFTHAAPTIFAMANLLRAGRAPADVMTANK